MKITKPGIVTLQGETIDVSRFEFDAEWDYADENVALCVLDWIEQKCAEQRALLLKKRGDDEILH